MNLKEELKFLGRNRSAKSESFQKRLEKAGFEIEYGRFGYWDYVPFVKIGDSKVFLYKSYTNNGNTSCIWRNQIDIINEIIETIEFEHDKQQDIDEKVEKFFEKLNK